MFTAMSSIAPPFEHGRRAALADMDGWELAWQGAARPPQPPEDAEPAWLDGYLTQIAWQRFRWREGLVA